jgi:oligopeptidase B
MTPDFDAKKWDGIKEMNVLEGEVTYLDVNALAEGKDYCNVGSVSVSPSHKYVAYSVDYLGDEKYELHVKDLESGQDFLLEKASVGDTCDEDGESKALEIDDFVWGRDDDTLYYVTMDEQHRPYRLYQRRNWHNVPVDTLLKEEPDDLFWCSVSKSMDDKYIFFDMASKETSEVWYIATETENLSPEMKCIAPRRNKVLYEVEHGQGQWFIVTNVDNSPNMKLMSSPAVENSEKEWKLVIDSGDNPIFDGTISKALDSVTVFDTHLALEGREAGIPRIWLYDLQSMTSQRLEFDESAYDVGLGAHYESNATTIAVAYDSMLTPPSSIEIALDGTYNERKVLKVKAVPGYNKDLFGCDRLQVLSRDGKTLIPVSIVYKKDTMDKVESGQTVPLHLYGYGSYGACMEADFGITRLPLLERGMIYAIAHIRGGGEMGRQWYEEPEGGKYLCKKNTFNDFVDVAKYFVEERKWTTPDELSCEGRSAGGLLIGAVLNQAPELFRAAILGVPFVDVAVTMTDSSVPLTSGEWVEWGNPNEEKFFQYMMEYSPMNNVQKDKVYPACWITGGLHDPRVAYWEPTKYAATVRHMNPENPHPICLKLDLTVGHFSASDRYKYYREMSVDYSFLLDQLNLA